MMSLPEELSNCLVLNTVAAARSLLRRGDAHFKPFGVTVQQFSLLAAIRFNPDTPVAILARRILLERTSLTRNLDLLEQRKFVRRAPDKARIGRICELTTEGDIVLDQLLEEWRKAQRDLLDGFTDQDAATFLRIINHFAKA